MKGFNMSSFIDSLIARAKEDKKTIVLPEGNDERILEAAQKVLQENIANIIIIGNRGRSSKQEL